ncbi:MAG: putative Rmd1/YagE family protein, partial [Limisphaerales bacterium]
MEFQVKAFHFTPKISLSIIKQGIPGGIIRDDSGELYYKFNEQSYLSIFSYGSIVFFNFSEKEQEELINKIGKILNCDISSPHMESFKVVEDSVKESEVLFDHIIVPKVDKDVIW